MIVEENANASQSTINIKKLTSQQIKKFKANNLIYSMLNKNYKRIAQRIKIVNSAIRTSTKQYISSNEFVSSTRKIIQMLVACYKLDQSKIIKRIHEQC
jgi:hypothetical protein